MNATIFHLTEQNTARLNHVAIPAFIIVLAPLTFTLPSEFGAAYEQTQTTSSCMQQVFPTATFRVPLTAPRSRTTAASVPGHLECRILASAQVEGEGAIDEADAGEVEVGIIAHEDSAEQEGHSDTGEEGEYEESSQDDADGEVISMPCECSVEL